MNDLSEFWKNYDSIIEHTIIALLLFAFFFLLSQLLFRKVFPALHKRKTKKSHPVVKQLLAGFRRPVTVYLQFIGTCLALFSIVRGLKNEVLPWSVAAVVNVMPGFLNRSLRIGTVVAAAWGLVGASGVSALLFRKARHRLDMQVSKSVTRFLSAVFNVIVISIAVVIILNELNYNISGLIAGLGLGGLTIALAAKDSAANFFGGLVLVVEKPFEIGDFISCDNVEGTVEDISLRCTKVRTNDGSLTIVPNSILAASPITNWSGAMDKRRADFVLNAKYGTPKEKLQAFIAAAREALRHDTDILQDNIVVCFADFSESSLDIRFIFYTAKPGYADYLAIRERVNYNLMDLAKAHEINFAFPTSTVYLEKQEPPAE